MVLIFGKNSNAKLQRLTTLLYFCGWSVPVQQQEFVATAVAGGGRRDNRVGPVGDRAGPGAAVVPQTIKIHR